MIEAQTVNKSKCQRQNNKNKKKKKEKQCTNTDKERERVTDIYHSAECEITTQSDSYIQQTKDDKRLTLSRWGDV